MSEERNCKTLTTTIVFSVFVFHYCAQILTCLLPFERCITLDQAYNVFLNKRTSFDFGDLPEGKRVILKGT